MANEAIEVAQRIAAESKVVLRYIVVCPEHGAAGPYSLEVAQEQVDVLNGLERLDGCVYKVLPLFLSV